MGLELILGSSGAGKSYHCYQEIIKASIQNPEQNYLMLVPEQFTLKTQKDIILAHPSKGILNIDVLSFERLAYRVFEELEPKLLTVLEDTGKSMVIRRVIEACKSELTAFNRSIDKTGFIDSLKSILSEFYQYDISIGTLENLLGKDTNETDFTKKIRDIIHIYKGFKSFLEDKYITQEEILHQLCLYISKSKLIQNSVIYIDGFTGFTPVQYKLLNELLKFAKEISITITINKQSCEGIVATEDLFMMSRKTMQRLEKVAEEANVPAKRYFIREDKEVYRYRNHGMLAHLEQQLFRYPNKACLLKSQEITIYKSKSIRSEIAYVGQEINRLVREGGYRYNQIAVVTGDLENYARPVEQAFEKYNIPIFLDYKRNILTNPFVTFIFSSIEMIIKDYSYESVFRLLKTRLLPIEAEQIDRLENYVLALGIKGNRGWNKEWTKKYRNHSNIDLKEMNILRETILSYIEPLRQVLSNKESTVTDKTKEIYQLFCKLEIEQQLLRSSDNFAQAGDLAREREYRQIYPMVINLLDKMVALLGDEHIATKVYLEILEAGLIQCKLGLVPPGLDQVVVGDIERTRLKDIKILFFMGVNDGIVPKAVKDGGIFTEYDKQYLKEQQIELAPDGREQVYIEQFYLYLNLTKPEDKLYISYATVDLNGKSLRPSYLIFRMMKMFPQLVPIYEQESGILDVMNPEIGIEFFIRKLHELREKEMPMDSSHDFRELYGWYLRDEAWRRRITHIIDATFYMNHESKLTEAIASSLYTDGSTSNVSRLEKYAACAFSHFMQYGMGLMERQEYKLYTPDIGNLLHLAIERFSTDLLASAYDWTTVPDDQRDRMVEQIVQETARNYENTVLFSSARNQYIIEKLIRITKRTVWALQQQLKQGDFVPSEYELRFNSKNQALDTLKVISEGGKTLHFSGVIDRLDKYEEDHKVYLKIIDYKSSNVQFDMTALYYGLQLQLGAYLNAAIQVEKKIHKDKEIVPAGIYYYHIQDPMIPKAHTNTQEEVDAALLSELKMHGLTVADKEVLKHIDQAFCNDGIVKSAVIPVSINKDGAISKLSQAATKEQFHGLQKFVNHKIKTLGQDILSGDIRIKPYKRGNQTACDYCPYSAICQFDPSIKGNQYTTLKEFKMDEIFMKLEKELE